MKRFVYWENHSNCSAGEGTVSPEALAAEAARRGWPEAALCDTNGIYGLIRFLDACRHAGVRPLVSVRVRHHAFDGIIIPRSMRGYARMCRFISRVHEDPGTDLAETALTLTRGDCIVVTAMERLLTPRPGLLALIDVSGNRAATTYTLARDRHIPPLLVYPVYYLTEAAHDLYRLRRAIHLNKTLASLTDADTAPPGSCWKPIGWVRERFAHMPDALDNTVRLAREAAFDLARGTAIMPATFRDSARRLRALCRRQVPWRYPQADRRVEERLTYELDIIVRMGFADYFLTVYDIVRRAPLTCGRGSGAASIVSYLLGITHVDPLAHNLFFERFLNPARPDPPDIDIDFPWDTRDDVLDDIFRRYGADRTAMVANHITLSGRSALRETAHAYGLPEREIRQLQRSTPLPQTNEIPPPWQPLREQAQHLRGSLRHLSVHCGGVVITPKPLRYYVPVEKTAKGVPVIQWEKDQSEAFGLVKIDILGNRSLAVVRDTLAAVTARNGRRLDYRSLNPLHDPATRQCLAAGETIGVFYVESPAMRQLQRKTGRGDYGHLVIHSSIIRPAAHRWINEYIERLRGKPYRPPLPEMADLFRETYGLLCYQEDITRLTITAAGFTVAQGERLRRCISKPDRRRERTTLRDLFYERLTQRGVSRQTVDTVWDMMESFSGYSFCKPHSASYALLSFKSCYLKCHYPAAFMAAVLTNRGGYYTPLAYISEARRLGLDIVPPHVNESDREYRGDGRRLLVGLMELRDLNTSAISALVRERQANGPFHGVVDLMRRTGIGAADTARLIGGGCLRDLERYNRPQQLYLARAFAADIPPGDRTSLYGDRHRLSLRPPPMRAWTAAQVRQAERDHFGFLLSEHPVAVLRREHSFPGTVTAAALTDHAGRQVRILALLISAKTVLTREGDPMNFVSFEDETAIFETVFFPKAYRTLRNRQAQHGVYLLTGKVEIHFGAVSVNVTSLRRMKNE